MTNKTKITAVQFGNLIGLPTRGKYYIKKMIKSDDKRTYSQWGEHFVEVKLIEKFPKLTVSKVKQD